MVVISVEPNMYTVVTCNTGQEGIGSSVPGICWDVGWYMADVINLAGHMQNLGVIIKMIIKVFILDIPKCF